VLSRRISGFTLIEILVVFVIISLMFALVPMVIKPSIGSQLKNSAREISILLRWTRTHAVTERQHIALWMNTADKQYQIDSREGIHILPEEVEVLMTVADHEIDGSNAAIRFYPDGSSSGGTIELAVENEGYTIQVDWLTGEVALQAFAEQ